MKKVILLLTLVTVSVVVSAQAPPIVETVGDTLWLQDIPNELRLDSDASQGISIPDVLGVLVTFGTEFYNPGYVLLNSSGCTKCEHLNIVPTSDTAFYYQPEPDPWGGPPNATNIEVSYEFAVYGSDTTYLKDVAWGIPAFPVDPDLPEGVDINHNGNLPSINGTGNSFQSLYMVPIDQPNATMVTQGGESAWVIPAGETYEFRFVYIYWNPTALGGTYNFNVDQLAFTSCVEDWTWYLKQTAWENSYTFQ
jgi:hypothetical protein